MLMFIMTMSNNRCKRFRISLVMSSLKLLHFLFPFILSLLKLFLSLLNHLFRIFIFKFLRLFKGVLTFFCQLGTRISADRLGMCFCRGNFGFFRFFLILIHDCLTLMTMMMGWGQGSMLGRLWRLGCSRLMILWGYCIIGNMTILRCVSSFKNISNVHIFFVLFIFQFRQQLLSMLYLFMHAPIFQGTLSQVNARNIRWICPFKYWLDNLIYCCFRLRFLKFL